MDNQLAHGDPVPVASGDEVSQEGAGERPRRSYGARSVRNINSVIRAKLVSDQRWGERNRQIIEYLDQGLSIRQIARLVGRGERQIRVVRERLADLHGEAQAYLGPSELQEPDEDEVAQVRRLVEHEVEGAK